MVRIKNDEPLNYVGELVAFYSVTAKERDAA